MSSSQKDENGAGESLISAVARGNRPLQFVGRFLFIYIFW